MNDKLMEDLRRDAIRANRVDKERAEVLGSLMKHPGWATYVAIIQAQVQSLSEEMLKPATGVDSLVASECIKGTMRGLLLAGALPSTIIEQMKGLQQEQIKADEEVEDE